MHKAIPIFSSWHLNLQAALPPLPTIVSPHWRHIPTSKNDNMSFWVQELKAKQGHEEKVILKFSPPQISFRVQTVSGHVQFDFLPQFESTGMHACLEC